MSCFLAVLACGLVCYLVSVLHLFRAHHQPTRYVGNGARTAAKMLSHAYDDDGKPKPKPSIIRPKQPPQPQPPKDACAAHRWRNDTDLKGGDLKGGMRAASNPAACCALCLRNKDCVAWTMAEHCWLKGVVVPMRGGHNGLVSGLIPNRKPTQRKPPCLLYTSPSPRD